MFPNYTKWTSRGRQGDQCTTIAWLASLASQDVVEIERSAGYAERLITRSIDRAGRE